MRTSTADVLKSLSETLLSELDCEASSCAGEVCGGFVVAFYLRMQALYRIALACISAWFAVEPLFRYGKTFHRLSPNEKMKVIAAWRNSRLSVKKDYLKLVFILVITAYYDSEEMTGKLGIERSAYLAVLSYYNGSMRDA